MSDLNHLVFHTSSITPDFKGSGFPPIFYHRLVSLCAVHLVDTDVKLVTTTLNRKDIKERDVTQAFFQEINEKQTLVSFYGSTYTLPVLTCRAVHHGVKEAKNYFQQREFYDNPVTGHIDMAFWLSNFGSSDNPNFDTFISTCALPPRKNGDVIQDLFRRGEIDTIEEQLQLYVLLMTLAFLRIYYVSGDINLKTFQGVGKKVLKAFQPSELCSDYVSTMAVRKFFFATKK